MDNPTLINWLDILLEPAVFIILGYLGYLWGHKTWKKQKETENEIQKHKRQSDETIAAHKAAWSLIPYFSENDNEKNMLVRGKKREDGIKDYYFRRLQAEEYYKTLQTIFFEKGHGIFLSKDVKQLLYEIRSTTYGLYHIANKQNEDEMKIEKDELPKRIQKIREELIKRLKDEVFYF
jgi:hypothetical protein